MEQKQRKVIRIFLSALKCNDIKLKENIKALHSNNKYSKVYIDFLLLVWKLNDIMILRYHTYQGGATC